MKILYICHRFPYPPKRGGKIRPFNMIKHLSEKHEVTVASAVRSPEEAMEGRGLQSFCKKYIMSEIRKMSAVIRMMAYLPTSVPSSMGYFYSPELARGIRRELERERFDLIFVHCSSAAQYVKDVRGIPKMLDFGDMDSQKWLEYARVREFPLSIGYYIEGTKLYRSEKALAERFDYCSCTTKAELETLNSYNVNTRTAWFPNGVDTEYFDTSAEDYDHDTICFIGRMDYFPNQVCMTEFCKEVFPVVRSRRPNVQFKIIGANPSPTIEKLGEIEGVTVTGSVPDVRPYVHRAALTVAPLSIARGTQNKILESLAMGVPVVASKEAAAGVDAVPGEHLLVASTVQEYVDAILGLLEIREERRRLSLAGRARMLSHHDWVASMKRLDNLVEQCLSTVRQA